MTLAVIGFGFIFNGINGYLNGRYLAEFSSGYASDWVTDPRFIIGVLLFCAGYAINYHSDGILRSLRKPGETGHKIPRAGLFKYITSANYFGEIVEWCGWAIATWSLPGLAFAVWTTANLVPRARVHHRWYKRKFEDYPRSRRIIIPFVY
jgi:protein-S-isoprenylcysteine O-methyltransferase Ste14